MRAYRLFRPRHACGVMCAVPEDGDPPTFVRGPAWNFERRLEDERSDLIGFDPRAARASVQVNGFYLFETFGRR